MLEDLVYHLFHACVILIGIVFARGAVDQVHAGIPAWKAYITSIACTGLGWLFISNAIEIRYEQHWGKLLALIIVQSLAFLWFRVTSSPRDSAQVVK
jgi:hypothetical protein